MTTKTLALCDLCARAYRVAPGTTTSRLRINHWWLCDRCTNFASTLIKLERRDHLRLAKEMP